MMRDRGDRRLAQRGAWACLDGHEPLDAKHAVGFRRLADPGRQRFGGRDGADRDRDALEIVVIVLSLVVMRGPRREIALRRRLSGRG